METTAKDFVLLCIDNEIYRYKEMKTDTVLRNSLSEIAISILEEFRQNIVNNC